MKCVNHPDRAALGYCSRCGKALCSECLVRLSAGNFCETCANPSAAARPRRAIPWWLIVLAAAVLFSLLRIVIH
ncbi:MAG: B-box zinc finger protein [bacterium]